jgi:hypothetical protein
MARVSLANLPLEREASEGEEYVSRMSASGAKAEIAARPSDVCFTPEYDHSSAAFHRQAHCALE